MTRLETERLTLRPFVSGDAYGIHGVVFSDPEVCEQFCGLPWTIEEVRHWVAYTHLDTRYGDVGYLAVVRREDRVMLGLVGLRPYVAAGIIWRDDPHPRFARLEMELTYAFGAAFQRQGYATEACNAVIGYAFRGLRLPRLAYAVHVHNVPSWKLMKRLGFRFERNLRPEGYEDIVGILDNHLFD